MFQLMYSHEQLQTSHDTNLKTWLLYNVALLTVTSTYDANHLKVVSAHSESPTSLHQHIRRQGLHKQPREVYMVAQDTFLSITQVSSRYQLSITQMFHRK